MSQSRLSAYAILSLINILSSYRYVAEVFKYVYKHRKQISGYKITWTPAVLRHFTAHLEPIPPAEKLEEEEEELEDVEESLLHMRKRSLGRQSYQFS